MKCARCATEIPAQSHFCLKCGAPLGAAPAAGTARVASAPYVRAAGSRKPLWIALAVVAVAALAAAGWYISRGRGSKVAEAPALAGAGGPLMEGSGRIQPGGPLVEKPATATPEVQRTDIMDYLRFLRQVDSQRLTLSKQQLGQVLNWSSQLQAANLSAEMGGGDRPEDDPNVKHKQTYSAFQKDMATWVGQWQQLSSYFLNGYPKPVPAECKQLRNLYYEVLKQASGSISAVANSLSQAMGGDPGAALDALSKMRGTASKSVDDACSAADAELGSVCDRFHLHKDFDITPEGGNPNPLSIG